MGRVDPTYRSHISGTKVWFKNQCTASPDCASSDNTMLQIPQNKLTLLEYCIDFQHTVSLTGHQSRVWSKTLSWQFKCSEGQGSLGKTTVNF